MLKWGVRWQRNWRGQRLRSAPESCLQGQALTWVMPVSLLVFCWSFCNLDRWRFVYTHISSFLDFSCSPEPTQASGIFVLLLMVHNLWLSCMMGSPVKQPCIATRRSSRWDPGRAAVQHWRHSFPRTATGRTAWTASPHPPLLPRVQEQRGN